MTTSKKNILLAECSVILKAKKKKKKETFEHITL